MPLAIGVSQREPRVTMPYQRTILIVRETLSKTFDDTAAWIERPNDLRRFRPTSGRWSIDEVLEHITLTNHFLMLTLIKWTAVACKRAARGDIICDGESDLSRIDIIGQRGSFRWERPEHMEPSGTMSADAIREILDSQCKECLRLLELMNSGEGSLCRIRMSVNDLGKVDLYQWLYFVTQHARRHLQQMETIESEYQASLP